MKKILFIFIIVLTIISCKKAEKSNTGFPKAPQDSAIPKIKKIQPQKTDEEILKEQANERKVREEIVSTFTVTKIGNGFTYKLFCEQKRDSTVNFKKIKIFKSKRLVQDLMVDSAYVNNKRQIEFEVNEDINFDGENDIKLVNWVGMHGSDFRYSFFIFNEIQLKYIYFPFLYNINAPEIDIKNKRIIESGTIGPSSNYEHIYKWEKGKLILVSGYDTNPMNYEVEKFQMKNGKKVVL